MRGSIVKRMSRPRDGTAPKPRYYCVVTANGHPRWLTDPSTGRAFRRKSDAEAHLAQVTASIHTGTWVQPSATTLGEHVDGWLLLARGRLKPGTWESYAAILRAHLLPDLGPVRLQQLTAGHLDRRYQALLAGGLSARTVAYLHTIVKAALADAVRKGLLTRNPADSATPPTAAPRPTHTTWTASQLATFLDHTAGTRHGVLWAFLALTGCRRGEALGLRWSDVDDDTRRVVIAATIATVAGRSAAGTPKSGHGRTVAIDEGLLAQLHAHRATQTRARMAAPVWHDLDLVFCRSDGLPWHPDSISRAFRAASTAAGLPPIRLHDLRHSWATLALQAGIHPKVVQERLGHSTVTITLGVYTHVLPSMHDQAASTIAALIEERKPSGVTTLQARA